MAWSAALMLLLTSGMAEARRREGWSETREHGYRLFALTNAAEDRFVIACDEIESRDTPRATGLRAVVAGRAPPAGSAFSVVIDRRAFGFAMSDSGSTRTECAACSADFQALWRRLRRSSRLAITLADGSRAAFDTKRAAAVLPRKPCVTGHED